MNDPILDELRRIRDESARRHNYDAASMVREFKQHELSGKYVVVNRHQLLKDAAAKAAKKKTRAKKAPPLRKFSSKTLRKD